MRISHFIEFILLAALWGGSFLFMRITAPEFGPIALIEVRVAVAALVLLPVLFIRKQTQQVIDNAMPIFWIGILNSAIPFTLFAFATLTLTAGYSSVTNATAPLWTAVIAAIWFKDKLSKAGLIGLIVGFSGVLILVWNELASWQPEYVWAISATLAATMCYGIAANYTRKNLQGVGSLAITVGSLVFASIQLLPLAIIYWPENDITVTAWSAAIFMGIFCTGVAYILFFRLLNSLGPGRAITVTYLIPVFGSLFGAVFLDEKITDNMLIGGAVILLGTSIVIGLIKLPEALKRKTASS